MNPGIGPLSFGGSGFAATAVSTPGKRAASFYASGTTAGASATALEGSVGLSAVLDSSAFDVSTLDVSAFAASDLGACSVFAFSLAVISVLVSLPDWAGASASIFLASSIFLLSVSAEMVSADLTSDDRSEEHTSELQSPDHLVCRLLLEKKKKKFDLLYHY